MIVKYTADDIDSMRCYVTCLIDPEREGWDWEWQVAHSSIIEDRLRTYIAAGVSKTDLGKFLSKKWEEVYAAKRVWADYRAKNCAPAP